MKILPAGQRIAVHVHGPTVKVGIPGQVQESDRLDEVVVAFPTLLYPTSTMGYGARVTVQLTNPQGLHHVDATIMDFTRLMPIEATLGDFGKVRTTQRRAYFRTQVELPLAVAVVASKVVKLGLQDRRGTLVNLAGGGLCLDSVLHPDVGDRVVVRVAVPTKLQAAIAPFLQCDGEVVRIEPMMRGEREQFRMAIRMLVRRDIERDPWVRLALDIQRGAHIDPNEPEPTVLFDDQTEG